MLDQATLLTALTVFLQAAGADVCSPEPLHSLCLQRFLAAMDAKEPQVSPATTPAAAQWPQVETQLLDEEEELTRLSFPSFHLNFSTHNSALKPYVLMAVALSCSF